MKLLAYFIMFINIINIKYISYIYIIMIIASLILLNIKVSKKVEVLLILMLVGIELKMLGII